MKKLIFLVLPLFLVGYFVYSNIVNNAKASQNVKEDKKNEEKSVVAVKLKELNPYDNYIVREGIVRGSKEVYLSSKAEGRVQSIYKDIGQRVKKGQVLAKIDGREYYAQVNVAKTGYEFARKSVSKTKDFFWDQVKQAKKARDLAKDAYEGAKKSGDEKEIAQAKAQYELAKRAVKTAESGYDLQVKIAKGNRDVAFSQLQAANIVAANTNLKAPFSGVIADVRVDVGDLVSPERPMFLLVDDTKKEIEISVSKNYLKDIEIGDKVSVVFDKNQLETKVEAISPMLDTHSRKGVIKLSLPEDAEIEIGTYVDVLIPRDISSGKEILVPQSAVVRVYDDNFVFVLDGDKVRKVKVELGEVIDDSIAIIDGLSGNEEVVVEGNQYLRDGDLVKKVN